ncbi:MAG TPA: hypothetical protein VFG57_00060 [Gaiella sp.]|nr:hypothetical protein [Gaiella sp.]HEU0057548.1 hypothetical protein [Gaiella sp.]
MRGMRMRKTVWIAVVAVALGVASSASAMTATLGEPNLVGKVALDVPITVTCDPPSFGLEMFFQTVSVVVEQAAGKQIARGSAAIANSYPQLLFPCNGTAVALSVPVLADATGPPFHGGKAVVRVTLTAEAGVPLPCCPGSYMSPFERQTAVVGPAEVRLR